jgi:serine-type D-Ala-D-Ala carboxypeptidase/endopeptidase (penicillin-binding protein 4)
MKRFILIALLAGIAQGLQAQPVPEKLAKAYQHFEADSQLKHAISSLYVIDAETGAVIFEKNAQKGLAGASTQKVITSATAFELLGKDFRYETQLGYSGKLNNGTVEGNLQIFGNGDPSFGSWRWERTRAENIIGDIIRVIRSQGIRYFRDSYDFGVLHFENQSIPNGWIWEDVGNYYGAGAVGLNWRENQYDVLLESTDNVGERVTLLKTEPFLHGYIFNSEVKSAEAGTGDNAYIYLPLGGMHGVIRGTIPIRQKNFRISGAMPDPANQFFFTLKDSLGKQSIRVGFEQQKYALHENGDKLKQQSNLFYTHISPTFDSLNYWFLKKSINLYGEAFIKTIAYKEQGFGSTDSGLNIVKRFWKEKGIEPNELNLYDGSGLSPLNRVTTHAQVEVLKFARKRDWFPQFYDALPEFNGMKMKSGTISDVKGFCGYQKSKKGEEYIFSFLVNNYSGKSSALVSKMYTVLDELK